MTPILEAEGKGAGRQSSNKYEQKKITADEQIMLANKTGTFYVL